jgi:hypothetical protein
VIPALRPFFEEQVAFRLSDGTDVEGGVFIGSTEFLALETLREDPDAYDEEYRLWLAETWKPEQEQRRGEILALAGNAKRYEDLRAAIDRAQVVPLIGSGMSVPSGLPTWADLLRRVRGFTPCDVQELERLLGLGHFEEAADMLAASTNHRLLNERIDHELRRADDAEIGGAVRLLPLLFPRLVLTTNLDCVLEDAFNESGVAFEHVLAGAELARYRSVKGPSVRILLKLHGDSRRGEGRVLLTTEYEATYAAGGEIREEIALLYRTNSLLFIGCSLGEDRTVRLIHEVANEDANMPKHYCLLPMPASEEARIEREGFLTERGIYPIWYQGAHDEALLALLDGFLPDSGE